MKIYTITRIKSNVCEVETKAFINYEKALGQWAEWYAECKEECEEAQRNGVEEDPEELILDPEHKHFSYDDGEYFNAIDLDTHEVEE